MASTINATPTSSGLISTADNSGVLALQTGGTTAVTIDTNGNLLVGSTSQSGTASTLFITNAKNTGNAARLGLMSVGGQSGGGDYPSIGYNMAFTSSTTLNYLSSDAVSFIKFNAGGIYTYTATSGTINTAISPTTGPYVAQGGTSWTSSSDERLKNITGEITGALNKVNQLRAATYTWKADESAKPQVGLIAQDLLKVLPEVVVVPNEELDKNGNQQYLGINYDSVIPLLTAAIQELNAKVDAQANIIAELQARNT